MAISRLPLFIDDAAPVEVAMGDPVAVAVAVAVVGVDDATPLALVAEPVLVEFEPPDPEASEGFKTLDGC